MFVSESLIPFHRQAEEYGIYVLQARASEAELERPDGRPECPSENVD